MNVNQEILTFGIEQGSMEKWVNVYQGDTMRFVMHQARHGQSILNTKFIEFSIRSNEDAFMLSNIFLF